MIALRSNDRSGPDSDGRFGEFGGRYVPEILVEPLAELARAWSSASADPSFAAQLCELMRDFGGRPTPLYYAERLSGLVRATRIYFKREDLNHTGSHKLNNCIGQVLLARRLGKSRVIAETGAGQHGVAIATVCARFGMRCTVFMGAADVERQESNVFRMRMLGADVRAVDAGSGTLKDALNAALREWAACSNDTHMAIGTAAGPAPFPEMVRRFQQVIGEEAREQVQAREGRLPDLVVAPVGGGSNAIGLFHAFRHDSDVRLVGVEAAGEGLASGRTAASINAGRAGVLHGCRTMVLQDGDGQIAEAHSVSAGLDYPAVGPEHAWLAQTGRASYVAVTDRQALDAFRLCSTREGIVPALESAHAIAHALTLGNGAHRGRRTQVVLVCLSGRGDKDIPLFMRPASADKLPLSRPSDGPFDVI